MGGYHLAFVVGAGLMAVAFLVVLIVVRPVGMPAHHMQAEHNASDEAEATQQREERELSEVA